MTSYNPHTTVLDIAHAQVTRFSTNLEGYAVTIKILKEDCPDELRNLLEYHYRNKSVVTTSIIPHPEGGGIEEGNTTDVSQTNVLDNYYNKA